MSESLLAVSRFFFLVAYFEIIRVGFRDKTYGMPIPALLVSITWEFTYCFIYPHGGIQQYIDYLWFALDVVIFYQLLKYWRTEIRDMSPIIFYFSIFTFLIISLILIILMEQDFQDGGAYSGSLDYFMMGILFLLMFYKRKSLRGQSVLIALSKLLSALFAWAWQYEFHQSAWHFPSLMFFIITTFIFDFTYLILVYLQAKKSLLFPVKKTA
jgi:hypothetical protein